MRYAQRRSGQKMHLVMEPGEPMRDGSLVPPGHLSAPLCGARIPSKGYRMTCNVPLGHGCRSCRRVARARGIW